MWNKQNAMKNTEKCSGCCIHVNLPNYFVDLSMIYLFIFCKFILFSKLSLFLTAPLQNYWEKSTEVDVTNWNLRWCGKHQGRAYHNSVRDCEGNFRWREGSVVVRKILFWTVDSKKLRTAHGSISARCSISAWHSFGKQLQINLEMIVP